ncbi:hypothetical protein AN216_04840 [Streptomyces oceani]|uniref:CopG family transcriptional regulator n=2 Tax=Streptomyces oceani TaxID=1075402 RepID=A0A1E7KM29_9ACTN|nr:hypothetical protein AN216_04840 [Streptomyces oceani]
MPSERIAAIRARAGARGFSAYVSAAVERQLQRDLLEELLDRSEAEAGPAPQGVADRVTQAFQRATTLADLERDESTDSGDASEEGQSWRGRQAG